MMMGQPWLYAWLAAPVNVQALKATMNAEPPTIHHRALPPPRKYSETLVTKRRKTQLIVSMKTK